MRLDRLIANSGIGTRSAVRSIISHGSVQVNGAVVTDASFHVKETDSITIDGQEINLQTKLYFLLDKPDGVLTAMEDKRLPCVADYIPSELKSKKLSPVGRLDFHTSGLLIITNDGELSHRLQSPKYEVPKIYMATFRGLAWTEEEINTVASGFTVTTALALCFNWYSGIIDLMFCCFWFLFEFIRVRITGKEGKRPFLIHLINSFAHLIVSCIISLLISSAVLVPTLLKLSERTHGKGGLSMLIDLSFIGGPQEIFLNYSFGMISLQGSVSLFAGSFVLLGVCLLFIASSKHWKEKILYGAVLLFSLLMFIWQPLVALFSMLRVVESFWYRYTYLGIFALIFLAASFYIAKDKGRIRSWMPPVTALVFSNLV